jgi:hypothetical protein
MPGPNVRSMAVDFWKRLWTELDLRRAIKLEHRADEETRIEVDNRLPHLALRGTARARYRVTTSRLFLRSDYFPDRELRRRIGSAAAKARNRALFCEDLRSGEVMCALAFHVDFDRTLPIHLLDLALCHADDHGLRAHSRFSAHLLLAFLAEIGAKDGRGRKIGFLSEHHQQERLASEFGFERAPKPTAVTATGDYMLMAPPPRLPRS